MICLLFAIACSDLPDAALVTPDQLAQTLDIQDAVNTTDESEQARGEIQKNRLKLNVDIMVRDCLPVSGRTYRLMAINPKSDSYSFYDSSKYQIRWRTVDGTVISHDVELECVAGGTYYVEVTDRSNSATGRAKVGL